MPRSRSSRTRRSERSAKRRSCAYEWSPTACPRASDLLHELRVRLGLAGDDEERRLRAGGVERVEHARRRHRVGAVVERERDPRAPLGPRVTASANMRKPEREDAREDERQVRDEREDAATAERRRVPEHRLPAIDEHERSVAA